MRSIIASILSCVLLSSCNQASAAAIDPADDIHCSVLAFYLHGLADHQGAPKEQRKALKSLHEWYAAKMRNVAATRWRDMAAFAKETQPLLDAIKADPASMRDEAATCADRALVDPEYTTFARGTPS